MHYQNPIIPGFYPDPSICLAGEDYYLVNSSFEFFPGVPLFHSRDLVNWEQISYVLTRKSQLSLQDSRTSGGIFAPTIRFQEGRFYMVTTNVTGGGNFYVWTDDIRGEWSDPIWLDQKGIDPSLFFDDDGTVYYQGTHTDEDGRQCIGQFALDIKTGERLTPTRPIWYGTGGKCPEGPHMYKIFDKYYLMIAEGGTEYGHSETIARADNPWGPFESCPHNPILTHRHKDVGSGTLHALGHADMVQTPQKDWRMVFHAIRPSRFMLHHIGRETMIAPFAWDADGWPVLPPITEMMELPEGTGRGNEPYAPFRDDFRKPDLGLKWSFLRNPGRENYSLSEKPDAIALTAGEMTLEDNGSPTMIAHRQQHFEAIAQVMMDFEPTTENAEAGMTVFHTKDHHYDIVVTKSGRKKKAFLRRRACDMLVESEPVKLPESGPVKLLIRASRLGYKFFAGTEGGELQLLGEGCTQLLSTECMVCTFTGCFFGLYAQGEKGAKAYFSGYSYIPGREKESCVR